MLIHLQSHKAQSICGKKGVAAQQISDGKLHLVTCLDCLRARVEMLENEVDDIYRQMSYSD